jgi:ComF family protein
LEVGRRLGLLDDLLNLLFPLRPVCPLCGGKSAGGEVCAACREALARYRRQPRCFCCGRPLRAAGAAGFRAAAGKRLLCPECVSGQHYFFLARPAGPYEGGLREAILRFKFGGKRHLAAPLGALLAEAVREAVAGAGRPGGAGGGAGGVPAVLVPVPLSRERQRERGFNQAELLAKEAAARTSLPVARLLRKVRETPPQAGLSRAERLRNLEGAFAVAGGGPVLAGLLAVLIDDVFTTGATADECARVLLAAGAGKVCVATLAGTG